jgi:protein-tyrosine-phosphatase
MFGEAALRSLLFVCSGNICRSPAAEGMTRAWLESRGHLNVRVGSCGTLGITGKPAAEFTLRAMAERGVDLGAHRSRGMSHVLLRRADLIVGMEYHHCEEVLHELGGDGDLVRLGVHVITEFHPEAALRNDAGIFDFVQEPWPAYQEGVMELERCVHHLLEECFPTLGPRP